MYNRRNQNKKQAKMEKMTKYDWPREAVLQLIVFWEKYEILYNPNNKLYHNKQARYEALTEVADKMKSFNANIGPTEIKNKINYLRGQYTREIAKQRNKGDGDDYIPSAFWYEKLSFLADFIKTRKTDSSFATSPDSNPLNYSPTPELESEPCSPVPSQTKKRAFPYEMSSSDSEEEIPRPLSVFTPRVELKNYNDRDEAFCNYLKAELGSFSNENLKEELKEEITLLLFAAKKKQRMSNGHQDNNIKFE